MDGLRRGRRLAVLLAAGLAAVASPASAGKAGVLGLPALNAQLIAQVNALRAREGLRPVRISPSLAAAAGRHSSQMAEHGFFAHRSADGSAFWRRIEHYYPLQGFRNWEVGENLLWASPGVDAREAVRLWLASPSHRRTLLDPRYREIGVAAVRSSAAPGVFRGLDVTIVTADFGTRR